MKLSKKALALLVGLTVSVSGTAFAAEGADSFSDVPQGHWAYDALDYLAKDGVIEGMGDGTFQGNRTMTRYEMASIVAKAMQKGTNNIGDQAVLDKLAGEYGQELATLKKQTAQNTKDIKDLKEKTDKFKVWGLARAQMGDDNGLVADGHQGTYNNRYYMDLEGQMKVSDRTVARFTIEKNAHYRDKEYAYSKIPKVVTVPSGYANAGQTYTVDKAISGIDKDSILGDDNHNGSISNIWVETQLGPQRNWYTNIGRKWNGIGMQNIMLGGQVDGIATYHPIEHGHGWWMSAQYWKPSADWTNTNVEWEESTTTTTTTGSTVINGTTEGTTTFTPNNGGTAATGTSSTTGTTTGTSTTTTTGTTATPKVTITSHRAPVVGTLNFWGPLGKYIDANLAYSRIVSHDSDQGNSADNFYTGAKNVYGIDLKAKLFKDFAVTGSYVKSDAKIGPNDCNWVKDNADTAWAVRFDYRGTDLNKKGSWGLYAKWVNIGALADIAHDDEWTTREPAFVNGVKGWYYGFKLVPSKNVEWETMWAPNLTENVSANWAGGAYHRHILRSWVDFHF